MNKTAKQIAFFLLIALIIMTMFKLNDQGAGRVNLDYTVFIEKIKNGEVAKVKIENRKIYGRYKSAEGKPIQSFGGDNFDFVSVIPYEDPELLKVLIANNVLVEGVDEDDKFSSKDC